MATRTNTAEGGTNGAQVTTTNSGGVSVDAWNSIGGSTPTALTFDNSQTMHGTLAYKLALASGQTVFPAWNGFTNAQFVTRFYMRLSALPSSGTRLVDILDINSVSMVRLLINASNQLLLQSNGGVTTAKLFTNTLSINTWYRIEIAASSGTSGATLKCDYYLGDSTTPVETGYSSTTSNNASIDNINAIRYGSSAATSTLSGNIWLDDLKLATATLTYLGPAAGNAAPTANAGSDQANIEPYTLVTLDGSRSGDTDGAITDYAWTQTAGSPTVMLSDNTDMLPTFIAPGTIAGTTLTFGLTVTDNLGATSAQDTVSIGIYPVTERAVVGGAEVPMGISEVAS